MNLSELKKGDLVEVLLKENAEFFDNGNRQFRVNENSETHIRGRFVVGYVSEVPENSNDEEYFYMHPSRNKENTRVASLKGFIGWRMYLNAVESIEKK